VRILVSGSSGLVGSALVPSLGTGGHQVVRLVRTPPTAGTAGILWDPARGVLDAASLEGFDAMVHLAGEALVPGRWNAARKARIRDSRVGGTRLLAETITRLARPPQVFLCASAVGYYGNRGDELLREDAPPGRDYLAEVCRAWEEAAEPAARKGTRVVQHRFGVILSPKGGALRKMLPPFRLGVGGRLGDGRQYMSWITLDDVLGGIEHALLTPELKGPVNTVAPHPRTNAEFTDSLGRVLGRPTIFPMPAFAARVAFGEVADALLLASQRVEPARLLASGYRFRHPDLEPALRFLLGRPA
jgi:uncharacterized protein (TIGR01777 family)